MLYLCIMNKHAKHPVYIWQQSDWPNFTFDKDAVMGRLSDVKLLQGRLIGTLSALGFEIQQNTALNALTEEVLHSSEIEGVLLNANSIRSSVARRLGIEIEGLPASDHYTEGVVEIALDATLHYDETLDEERLFSWHGALFPTGRSGLQKITVADWRKGKDPMLIVSGAMGKEKVHYQAPDSKDVPQEMSRLLGWIEKADCDNVVKAAIAHYWFVAIHPFDDGNGRLARTITDLLMARSDGMPHRYYSVSTEIRNRKKEYYAVLERTSCGEMDVTEWILWFLDCVKGAIKTSEGRIEKVMMKSDFWDKHRDITINERQRKVVDMLFGDFEGKLNTSKWAKICKCSQDTALRDINDLIEKGILRKTAEGGRSTNYELRIESL